MMSLIKDINLALLECRDERPSGILRGNASLKRSKQRSLCSIEGLAADARRPFLQHEFGGSLDAGNHQPLADLPCLNCDRPSQSRHGSDPRLIERCAPILVPTLEAIDVV